MSLTIGELAKKVGVRTSALRYYEEQGLLAPNERTAAGYRMYAPEAEHTLRFIHRAQRLGFSLADIRNLLAEDMVSDEMALAIAENRYVTLERQLTELLVVRHELQHFLRDLRSRLQRDELSESVFARFVDRVCASPSDRPSAASALEWLVGRTECALASTDARQLLEMLRGRHVHIWQEDNAYSILVVGHDPATESALRALASLEANCQAHPAPTVSIDEEGYLLVVHGDNAFIYAQLFLALEQETTELKGR